MSDRLFCGVFPSGIVWSDRGVREHGDYRRLAFLDYAHLNLQLSKGVPKHLEAEIRADAAEIIAKRGQRYDVSACRQYVILGSGDMTHDELLAAQIAAAG